MAADLNIVLQEAYFDMEKKVIDKAVGDKEHKVFPETFHIQVEVILCKSLQKHSVWFTLGSVHDRRKRLGRISAS